MHSPSCPLNFEKHSIQKIDGEEWEVEETNTLFEFGNSLTLKDIEEAQYQCKVIGLESLTPFIQIGSNVFQGQLKNALGNDLIFSKSDNPPSVPSQNTTYSPDYDRNHPSHCM
ncbi:hypothetical protein HMI55_001827 [Coelomomyces lativittatus]|nr:hypothetical protein HMI55_001827 [Coelomomyces lativittatus]